MSISRGTVTITNPCEVGAFFCIKEIARLAKAQAERGIAIIPLKVYLKHGFAKVLIGVGQGKKEYDKRQTIKERDQKRDIRRKYGV